MSGSPYHQGGDPSWAQWKGTAAQSSTSAAAPWPSSTPVAFSGVQAGSPWACRLTVLSAHILCVTCKGSPTSTSCWKGIVDPSSGAVRDGSWHHFAGSPVSSVSGRFLGRSAGKGVGRLPQYFPKAQVYKTFQEVSWKASRTFAGTASLQGSRVGVSDCLPVASRSPFSLPVFAGWYFSVV